MRINLPQEDQHQQQQQSQSVKRRADDQLESEQRLAKRLNNLQLDQNGRLRLASPTSNTKPFPPQVADTAPVQAQSFSNDGMQVEDTPNRVYITDLDQELAEIEEEEEAQNKLLFLPDIEAQLKRLPQQVFADSEREQQDWSKKGNELVLYSVPNSLSVPEEKDSVRKAILESRARARQDQSHEPNQESDSEGAQAQNTDMANGLETMQSSDSGSTNTGTLNSHIIDEDAMDIG